MNERLGGLFAVGADVDKEILDFGGLPALLLGEKMQRLGADKPRNPVFADQHTLADDDAAVDSADAAEVQKALLVDARDDEADLVHMGAKEHL
jgi:hypothetical protein